MFQPLGVQEYDSVDVLYLSSSRRSMWQVARPQQQMTPTTPIQPSNSLWHPPNEYGPQTSPQVRSPTPTNAGDILSKPPTKISKKYLVTPQTNVLAISREYRFVFMIDLSSSLATVDGLTGRLLIEDAFETLTKCLSGLVRPYGFDNPYRAVGALIEPVIHVTVLAECSQFASNLNVIPILEEYPTLRVLLQNVVLTSQNSSKVLEKLKEGIDTFQNDLIAFRKSLLKRREKMGYALDVRGEREEEREEGSGGGEYDESHPLNATARSDVQQSGSERKKSLRGRRTRSSSRVSLRGSSSKPPIKISTKHMRSVSTNTVKPPPSPLPTITSKHQFQKQQAQEVWGVGKTGGNLSYLLHAGLFALGLQPSSARPGFVLITDGVIKSNIQDEAIIRQLRRDDVNCSVIQLGGSRGFTPGCTFGLVADNEILRFLATATLGHFMYAEECLDLKSKEAAGEKDSAPWDNLIQPPNIYHRMLLIRDICLGLQRKDSKMLSVDEKNDDRHRLNFPWDPSSVPMPIENHLLKYQEYSLPSDFSHIIAARVRQGFGLQSLTVEDHSTKSGEFALRKERIQLVLSMQWQPNITVEYRIRASWFPAYIAQVESTGLTGGGGLGVLHGGIFARSKAPKAEIFIRAYGVFAHTLQNWDALQRRAQMMGLVLGEDRVGDYAATPLSSKVYKLKKFLSEVYRVDEVLKSIIGHNARYLAGSKPVSDDEGETPVSKKEQNLKRFDSYVEAFKDFWNHVNGLDIRTLMFSCYDTACIDILIAHLRPFSSLKFAMSYEEYIDRFEENIRKTATQIKDYLEKHWMTFISDDDEVFIKILQKTKKNPFQAGDDHLELASYDWNRNQGENMLFSNMQQVVSFVELRLRRENGNCLSARLMFFNADVYARRRIVRDLKDVLGKIRNDANAWRYYSHSIDKLDTLLPKPDGRYLKICKRPLSSLLMRDPRHLNSDDRIPQYLSKFSPLFSQRQVAHKPWFIARPTWLTAEFIVPNYLRHITWKWQIEQVNTNVQKDNDIWKVSERAFQFICQRRLDQKFDLVSSQNHTAHFYAEYESNSGSGTSSMQYFISKDPNTGVITTELWIEPTHVIHKDNYDLLINSPVFLSDKSIISRLVTFDKAHSIGRTRTREHIDAKPPHKTDEPSAGTYTERNLNVADLFDMTTVLQHGIFLIASFPCPQFSSTINVNENESSGSGHATPDGTMSPKPSTSSTDVYKSLTPTRSARPIIRTSPSASPKLENGLGSIYSHAISNGDGSTETKQRVGQLLEDYKQAVVDLSPNRQDYALLHYFVEQALSHITDGEVMMKNHCASDEFWRKLTMAMFSTGEQSIRNTALQHVHDIRQLRCFIKVFDPKSFIVILYPMLSTTIEGMKKQRRSSRQFPDSDITASGFLKLLDSSSMDGVLETWDIRSLGVVMFECRRLQALSDGFMSTIKQGSNNKISEDMFNGNISIKPVPFLIEENDGLGSTLRPQMFEGRFHNNLDNIGLSERTLRLTQDVVKIYERNYVRSIYVCLLQGKSVESGDFDKLLEICHESNMDVDVTGYVNVQTLLRNNHDISADEMDDVHQRFLSILGHYFEPVHTGSGNRPGMYCYRPTFARFSYRNATNDEKLNNLLDLTACSHNPLLIRLESTITKKSQGEEKPPYTAPVTHLPSSYEFRSSDGTMYNLQPEGIGNEQSPVASVDGTRVTLHIVCLTLPWTQVDESDHDWNLMSNLATESPMTPQPSMIDAMRSKPTCFNSLTRDKQEALAETEARLLWLLTEEIMHGLLRSGPVNQPVLDYIESQLEKKNPFVDFPISMEVPLTFVKRSKRGREIFLEQLAKDKHSPYPLSRIGDYFYVNEDIKPLSMREAVTTTEPTTPLTPLTDSDLTTQGLGIRVPDINEVEDDGGDEFCQGLGISIVTPPERSEFEDDPLEGNQVSHRQLYWLLLIPQQHNVQIYFYSKSFQSVNRSEIIKHTKVKISEVLERTNRLILLEDMAESKLCSKFLVAPDEDETKFQYSSDEMADEEDNSYGADGRRENLVGMLSTSEVGDMSGKKFKPGQFECPMIFFKQFPLHWRLQSNSALNIIAHDVLGKFAVKNRSNMFVIPGTDGIVYCKLSEVVVTVSVPEAELSADENTRKTNSPFGPPGGLQADSLASPKSSPHYKLQASSQQHSLSSSPRESSGSGAQSPQHSPKLGGNLSPGYRKTTQRTMESRELVLAVHGLDSSSWIEEQLVDMLDNRLQSQITLKEVQQFLTRNPNSRLSPADIDFILPMEKSPTSKQVLRLPALIKDPYGFMQFMHQNVLASSLRSLTGPEVVNAAKKHLRSMFGFNYTDYDGSSENRQISSSDSCYYYNCLNRSGATASSLEMKVGQGIAGICFTLLHNTGYPCVELPFNIESTASSANLDPRLIEECLDCEVMDSEDQPHTYQLLIEIWHVGQVDPHLLLKHLCQCYRQSICEYLIEMIMATDAEYLKSNMQPESQAGNSANVDPSITQGSALYTQVLSPLFTILQKAGEWNTQAVSELQKTVSVPPWGMRDVISQIYADLVDVDKTCKPIIAKAYYDDDSGDVPLFDVLQPDDLDDVQASSEVTQNSYYIIISGNRDFQQYFDTLCGGASNARQDRYFGNNNQVTYTVDYFKAPIEKEQTRNSPLGPRRQQKSASEPTISAANSKAISDQMMRYKSSANDPFWRHHFFLMSIDSRQFAAYTYNWTDAYVDKIFNRVHRTVYRQEHRSIVLNNIVHQKMGLFHHAKSIPEVVQELTTIGSYKSVLQSTPPSHPNTGRTGLSTLLQTPYKGMLSPAPVGSTGVQRNPLTDMSVRAGISSMSSTAVTAMSSPPAPVANFGNLQQLVMQPVKSKAPSGAHRPPLISDNRTVGAAHAQEERGKKKTEELIYTAARTAAVNDVLKDSTTEPSTEQTYAQHPDLLIRHGSPFLNSYIRRSSLQTAHEKAFSIYTKWAKRYQDPRYSRDHNQGERMPFKELNTILRSSRLLHFCRTPLLFSEIGVLEQKAESRIFTDPKLSSSSVDSTVQWYNNLVNTFMREYAAYLEGIGMQIIVFGPGQDQEATEKEAYMSKFKMTDELTVECPVVYLLKVFEGGTIMCQVRITDMFVSVTLYTLHRRYGRMTYTPWGYEKDEARRFSFRTFTEECDTFKQLIHVNSFVYDFHLRYITRALDKSGSVPQTLNLVHVIRHFASLHTRGAAYSRNRIFTGLYECDGDSSVLDNLFNTISRNADRYGLQALQLGSKVSACFLQSDSVTFESLASKDKSSKPNFRYTLLLCPAPESFFMTPSFDGMTPASSTRLAATTDSTSSDQVILQYYVIASYGKTSESRDNLPTATSWSKLLKSSPENTSVTAMNEVMAPETHTFLDVVQNAKMKIDSLISQAITFTGQDYNWNRMLNGALSNSRGIQNARAADSSGTDQHDVTLEETVSLVNQFDKIDLLAVDTNFAKFFQRSSDWLLLLDFLHAFYPTSGDVLIEACYHLFLFYPPPTFNYAMHIQLNVETNDISFHMIRQEKRSQHHLDEHEKKMVADVARTIAYYMIQHVKLASPAPSKQLFSKSNNHF
ncbi:unnamed protein product [Umbelopsis ramanniana]